MRQAMQWWEVPIFAVVFLSILGGLGWWIDLLLQASDRNTEKREE